MEGNWNIQPTRFSPGMAHGYRPATTSHWKQWYDLYAELHSRHRHELPEFQAYHARISPVTREQLRHASEAPPLESRM